MKISEAASGVGEEMADVGMAMQRAVDKTENMRARANAMDELEAAGAFDDQLSLTAGQDDIDRQLHELSSQSAVDDDLARLKAELGQGTRRHRRRSKRATPPPARRALPGEPGMIVRISTEGQYELPDEDADKLNELDNEVVAAVEAGDEERFHDGVRVAARAVRSDGTPVADDVLEESDVIIPPPDLTFAEARRAVHRRRPDPRLTSG